jgi:predicted nuclease with TOPRIM domain
MEKLKQKLNILVREREELLVQLEVLSEDWSSRQERHIVLSTDVQTLREENQRLLENVRAARKVLASLPEGQVPKKKARSSRLRKNLRRKSG